MYKKNAMAFDINFNDKKRVNTIENKPKTEVIPNEDIQMGILKRRDMNVLIVEENLKEKHIENMFLFVKEFFKEKKILIYLIKIKEIA